jgi:hypothetical protein
VSTSDGVSTTCIPASIGTTAAEEGRDCPDAAIWILVVTSLSGTSPGKSAVTLTGFTVSGGESDCEFAEGSAGSEAGAAGVGFPEIVKRGVAALASKVVFAVGGDTGDEGLMSGVGARSSIGLAMD